MTKAQTVKISKRVVDALRPGETRWDSDLRGFGVRMQRRDRVYILKARVHGRQRWFSIGPHGSPWTPDTARKHALQLLGDIAAGRDPAEARMEARDRLNMAELCDLYLAEGCTTKKASTIATDRGRIERHIKPLLGKRDAKSMTRADVERFMRDVADGKTAANVKTGKHGRAIVAGGKGTATRTVGLMGGIFSFAVDRGICEGNPAHGVKRFKDRRNERFLGEAEFQALGATLSEMEAEKSISPFVVAAIRLLLLTGARKGEILSLRWSDVDLENKLLQLGDSKTGQKVVYLSEPAAHILNDLPRLKGNPHVIVGDKKGAALVNLRRPWLRICERAEISNVRLHDLRHTFASIGATGGLSLPMIGKLLGHTNPQTTARYSHLAADPIRAANEAIGRRFVSSMTK